MWLKHPRLVPLVQVDCATRDVGDDGVSSSGFIYVRKFHFQITDVLRCLLASSLKQQNNIDEVHVSVKRVSKYDFVSRTTTTTRHFVRALFVLLLITGGGYTILTSNTKAVSCSISFRGNRQLSVTNRCGPGVKEVRGAVVLWFLNLVLTFQNSVSSSGPLLRYKRVQI